MILRLSLVMMALSFLAALQAGCSSAPGMEQVSGKVAFTDGAMPKGEIATIRFEPIAGTNAPGQSKGASGDIQPDGTYQLYSMNKGDGAFIGEYRVCFTFLKTYVGRESQVDAKFTAAGTTPLRAKVAAGGKNKFDFEVTRAPGH